MEKLNKQFLIDQYKIIHSKERYGTTGWKHSKLIQSFIDKNKVESILDYGCGQSGLLDKLIVDKKYYYDPAIDQHSDFPNIRVDMITCTDVMEHLLEEDVDDTLNHIKSFSNSAYFNISLLLAKHRLPNGMNCHTCVKPSTWWKKKLEARWNHVHVVKDTPDMLSVYCS